MQTDLKIKANEDEIASIFDGEHSRIVNVRYYNKIDDGKYEVGIRHNEDVDISSVRSFSGLLRKMRSACK